MHAVGDTGVTPVPAFLTKLWTLVEDSSTDEFICWDVSGKSFHVFDQGRFSKEVLPLYFKHSNIASFIRQLNMYGFRKVVGVESGGLKVEKDDMEFAHQYFQRDNEALLEHIKRKVPNVKSDEMKVRPDDVQRVLHDVRAMKGKQDTVNNKLEAVKRENELLWLEIASLRQKHMKQQQIVNKLIQFLMSLVGNRGVDRKRKMPLMLNDASQLDGSKMAKYGSQLSIDSFAKGYQVTSPESHTSGLDEGQAPTHTLSIHEVTDQMPAILKETLSTSAPSTATTVSFPPDVKPPLIEDVEEDESADILRALVEGNVPPNGSGEPLEEPPFLTLSAEELPLDTPAFPITSQPTPTYTAAVSGQAESSTSSASRVTDAVLGSVLGSGAVVPANRPSNAKVLNREMSEHLDTLQNDLDSLKDILSGGQYTFEPSTIMGLFNLTGSVGGTGNDNMFELGGLSGLYADQQPSTSSADYITGNEVVQYNPPDDIMTLFDLGDLSQSTPLDDDDNQASGLNTPNISADMMAGPRLMDPSASTTTSTEEVD